MQIKLPTVLIDKIIKETDDKFLAAKKVQSPLKRFVEFDGTLAPRSTIKALYAETKDLSTDYAGKIKFLNSAHRSKKNLKVHDMESLHIALRTYFEKDYLKGYVFTQSEYNSVTPYLLTDIDLHRSIGGHGKPALNIYMHFVYADHNGVEHTHRESFHPSTMVSIAHELEIEAFELEQPETKKHSGYTYDFECKDGILLEDILNHKGIFKETAELHELYDEQIARFFKFLPMYGQQFRVRGDSARSGWWSTTYTTMLTEGKPSRCVMDTIPNIALGETPNSRRVTYERDEDVFSDVDSLATPLSELNITDFQPSIDVKWLPDGHENKGMQPAPMHPALRIFHLERQDYHTVHVNNLAPYKYKEDIEKFLVLPAEVKSLVQMLVQITQGDVDDVIEGKSQSTIITCIGDPGVGKTLTAEVIAEACKKPLYKVPADQLGGDAEQLESKLTQILKRAERWDCVLMIDEANAYVHARGNDINQNAIVGVFLRRLEYFKGVLFLTTNQTRDDGAYDIDDAILSRSTAVFKIELPDDDMSTQIWKIQAKLLKVEGLKDETIAKLVKKYRLSGRSIRQLLKLSSRWAAHKEEPLSFKHFETCSKFIPFTHKEKVKNDSTQA